VTLTTLLLSKAKQKVTYRTKGVGEPLVLIHGVGMQSAAWVPQLDFFADRYQVIALDMPGILRIMSLGAGRSLMRWASAR